MKEFQFNPTDGYLNTAEFPNPPSEADTREQIQELHSQTRDFINGLVALLNGTSGAKEIGSEVIESLIVDGLPAANVYEQILALAQLKLFSTNFKYIRIADDKSIEYSQNGQEWFSTSNGVVIYNGVGSQMPVRKKIMIKQATLTDDGEYTVIVAQKGEKGDPGKDGSDGKSFVVMGHYNSIIDLRAAHPSGEEGDAYSVGTDGDNVVYVWDINKNDWSDIGPIIGPPGEKGDPGDPGEAGIGVPKGGAEGQFLRKRSTADYDTEFADIEVSWGKVVGVLSDQTDLNNVLNSFQSSITNINKQVQSTTKTITIQPSEFVEGVYTLSDDLITETSNQEILPVAYSEENKAMIDAFNAAAFQDVENGQTTGQTKFICTGEVPTIPINIRVIFRGDK